MEDKQKDNKRGNENRFSRMPKPRRNKPMRNKPRNDDDFNWAKVLKVVLSWSAIILGVFIVMTFFKNSDNEYELSYQQYQKVLSEGQIKEATIKKSDINNFDFHGILKEPIELVTQSGKRTQVDKFVVTLPYIDSTTVGSWTAKNINFKISKEDNQIIAAL